MASNGAGPVRESTLATRAIAFTALLAASLPQPAWANGLAVATVPIGEISIPGLTALRAERVTPVAGLPPWMERPRDPDAGAAKRKPLVFGAKQHEPAGTLSSFKDPCAKENLNRNDEPLSQRVNCAGLGIPSGWFFPARGRAEAGR
ncbi:MAG TPA: hypothetical protein VIT62_15690 [Lysobacter sp.]